MKAKTKRRIVGVSIGGRLMTETDNEAGAKTAHTPGPWKFGSDGVTDDYIVTGPGKCFIAAVDAGEDCDNKDNARLIAAAPDLLAAAKAMVSGWDEFTSTDEGQMDSAATQIPKLRAAISRAEGGH